MIARPLADASDDGDVHYSPCKRRRVDSPSAPPPMMVQDDFPDASPPCPLSPSLAALSSTSSSPLSDSLRDTSSTSAESPSPSISTATCTGNTNTTEPTPLPISPTATPLSASSSLSSLPSDAGYLSDLEISRLRFPSLSLPLRLSVLEDCLPESLMSIDLPAERKSTRRGRTATPKVRAYGIPSGQFILLPRERGLQHIAYPHLFVSYAHAPGPPQFLPAPPPSPPKPKPKRRGRPKTKTPTPPPPRIYFPGTPTVSAAVDESAMRTQLARLLQLHRRAGGDIPDRMAKVFSIAVRAGCVTVCAMSLDNKYSLEEVFSAPVTPDGLVTLARFLRDKVSGTAVLRERVACIDAWSRVADRKVVDSPEVSVAATSASASSASTSSASTISTSATATFETSSESSVSSPPSRNEITLPRLLPPTSMSPKSIKCQQAALPACLLDTRHSGELATPA